MDKFQILRSSDLWREIAMEVAPEYPDVEAEYILVDNCAMRLIQHPTDFDVIVTENLFGDILSDEASMLAGSLGMMPSASLAGIPEAGETKVAVWSAGGYILCSSQDQLLPIRQVSSGRKPTSLIIIRLL